jgi:hypothetical protein
MRYKFSEETKAKGVKKHQISMGINYGFVQIFLIYLLFNTYNHTHFAIQIFLICFMIAPFFAWKYFLNQTKRVLSTEYEIVDEGLIIYEHEQIKKRIQFRDITKFEKASLGYKILSYQTEQSFIFYGIENEEELINIVQNRIDNLKHKNA